MNEIKLRYPKCESVEDMQTLVAKAIASANTMKQKVQYAGVSLIIMAAKHPKEALNSANYLVTELGKGVKAEGLVKFLVDKGGFRIAADPAEGFVSVKNEEWIRANLEAAKQTPWWSYAPATPFKGFVLEEEIAKVLKRAKAQQLIAEKDEKKAAKIEIDVALLDTFNALLKGKPVHAEGAMDLIERIIPVDIGEDAPADDKEAA